MFSDHSHSAPSFIILWSFALQNWATTSFIASRTRRWQTILPLLFPLCAPQRGKGVYKRDWFHYKLPPILVAKSNRQKGGRNIEWVQYILVSRLNPPNLDTVGTLSLHLFQLLFVLQKMIITRNHTCSAYLYKHVSRNWRCSVEHILADFHYNTQRLIP